MASVYGRPCAHKEGNLDITRWLDSSAQLMRSWASTLLLSTEGMMLHCRPCCTQMHMRMVAWP